MHHYAGRLGTLIRKTAEMGARPLFVTQPTRKYRLEGGRIVGVDEVARYNGMEINGVDYYHIMRMFDHVTCETAWQHHVLCIDLDRDLLPSLRDDDFYDYVHMTPRGCKKWGAFFSGN